MEKSSLKSYNILLRYILVLVVGLGNLYLFYAILTPPTVHVVNSILSLFTETSLQGTSIFLQHVVIEIVPACVMGSAFYLLFALVFLTGDIKPQLRTKLLAASLASLFALNILRILFLILIQKLNSFEIIHWILWNFVSAIFIVAIWVTLTRLFKITSIPVYTDFKYLASFLKKK